VRPFDAFRATIADDSELRRFIFYGYALHGGEAAYRGRNSG
jgi:hypothetical protein